MISERKFRLSSGIHLKDKHCYLEAVICKLSTFMSNLVFEFSVLTVVIFEVFCLCVERAVRVFDCRSKNYKAWAMPGEVERVIWNHYNPFCFLVGFYILLVYY